KAAFWKWYADYFPITLIKEVDLDPSKNYIFGYHPHGVISVGAWTNFATEANDFSKKFPGITCRLLTLASNFNIPLYREYLMAHGCASVSRQSCENILKKGPGNSILIVVGGAGESLNARPGVYDLVLKRRLGFIKLAIRHGKVWKFQKTLQKLSGWTMPLFHGRGVFNYNLGILPHRRPITTIVGRPIEVTKIENPTEADLLEVQKKYIDELFNIWNTYKDKYAKNRVSELTLIE
ncbi:3726_t:CDS:2, partial [Scutellospora calospora]